MTEEEKKAIESFKEENDNDLSRFEDFNDYTQFKIKRDKTILNLIQKLQEENNNKDKTIDNLIKQQQEREEYTSSLEEKLSLIETYYDISDLDRIVKEDV